jgi:3-hydroxyacyl-[acyl-carrier-protein] dehydratase
MTHSTLKISPKHPAFAGHFPGQPLLPGVSLLAEVLEVALSDSKIAKALGSAPCLSSAKFLAPVRPGAQITVHLKHETHSVLFEVREGDRIAATGKLTGPSS